MPSPESINVSIMFPESCGKGEAPCRRMRRNTLTLLGRVCKSYLGYAGRYEKRRFHVETPNRVFCTVPVRRLHTYLCQLRKQALAP